MSYQKLHETSKATSLFASIQSLLEWDQETYMPNDAADYRGQQVSAIANLVHKQKTSPKFVKELKSLINLETGAVLDTTLSPQLHASLREYRRDYLQASKIPASFVKLFSKTTSQGLHAWSYAKKNDRFSHFAPHLEKIVKLSRKKAEYLGYKDHPYDALLDLYEPGITVATLTPLFSKLKTALTALVKEVADRPRPPPITGHFAESKQLELSAHLLKIMGFDKGSSRLDLSMHPFCVFLHSKDVRMTTHLHTHTPFPCIFSVLHEGGHGLYDQGLPEEQYGSPLGEAASVAVHESQSRFWETFIGHGLPFWKHFYPVLQKTYPETFTAISLEDFYRTINTVKRSFIRIDADEVTYSLHVIMRFEIEKALIEGSLKVKDLPKVWNQKMEEYLGVTPKTDAEGCLQDTHWAGGYFGYFPSYTLGNIYAAQLFDTFQKEHPQWEGQLALGDLSFVRLWLKEKIHKWGREYIPTQLIERATGSPVSESHYIHYLEKKYRAI
ncbi:MAG TPA: carboxypeptidase M32 [Rhabdochlamydiaceae bacterium]